MFSKLWGLIKQKPGRVALAVGLLLAVANAALLANALARQSSTEDLTVQVENLQFSLEQLRLVDQEGLQSLQAEAEAAEAQLADLKAAFPTLGNRFDLYRQAFALASRSNVEVTSVETGSTTLHETPAGYLSTTSYAVKGLGSYSECLDLMERLEGAGLETLALDQLFMDPLHCEFNVVLASSIPASQVDPVEALGDG